MRLIVIPQGVRRVLPALVNQFIGNIKDSSLVYFLGLLASERELFRVGQDQAVSHRQSVAAAAAGLFYLLHHRAADPSGELHRPAAAHGPRARIDRRLQRGCTRKWAEVPSPRARAPPCRPRPASHRRQKPLRGRRGRVGPAHGVRAGQGAAGRQTSTAPPGTVTLRHRPVRLRQVDAAALPQPAGRALRRRSSCSTAQSVLRLSTSTSCAGASGMVFQQFNLFPDHDRAAATSRCRCAR